MLVVSISILPQSYRVVQKCFSSINSRSCDSFDPYSVLDTHFLLHREKWDFSLYNQCVVPSGSNLTFPIFIYFVLLLLAYNCCTMWHLHMCLQYILIRFASSIILTQPLCPLRKISTAVIVLFSYMNTKYIHHILPPSLFPHAHLHSVVPTPLQDLFYFSVLHFLSIY
jgi:hypothetical protein